MRGARLALTALALVACRGEPAPPAPTPPELGITPNAILQRAPLTFVRGTLGDDAADRLIATQIGLVAPHFVSATVIDDVAAEPPLPPGLVVYGRPDENRLVQRLGPSLPFEIGPGRLAIGGEVLTGDDLRLIAAVPSVDASVPSGFLYYAGTGPLGVAEINGVSHGPDAILVADTFGRLVTGRWVMREGKLAAELGPRARRIAWRTERRTLEGAAGASEIAFHTPEMLPAPEGLDRVVDACMRGLASVVAKLEIARPTPVDVYLYPDRRSKQSLTGDPGDGHAVPAAHALHVLMVDPDNIAHLVAHEGTHVLAVPAWGLAGTSLLGEGLAVWVAGGYAGTPLSAAHLPASAPSLATLVKAFRQQPEADTYPLAGRFVGAAIALGGLERVRDFLYPATAGDWDEAWRRAGMVPEVVLAEAMRR